MQDGQDAGSDPAAIFRMAEACARRGDGEGVAEQARRLAALPESGPRWLAEGRILRLQGRAGAATDVLQRAVAAMPGRDEPAIALTNALMDAGEPAAAAAAGRKALERHPGSRLLHFNTLRAEAARDPAAVDLAELDGLLAAAPGMAAAHRFRLTLLRRLRRFREAAAAVDAFADACPNRCDGVLEHAGLALLEGEAGRARDLLRSELERPEPDMARLRLLGQAAVAAADEAVLHSLRDHVGALADTAERAELAGRLALQTGDIEAGLAAFSRGLALAPDHRRLWLAQIDLLTQLGRGGEGGDAAASAPDDVRLSPEVAVKRATAYWAAGRPEDALAVLRDPSLPAHVLIPRHLSQVLSLLGRPDEAREVLADWTPQDRDESATLGVARAMAARWNLDTETALAEAEMAARLDPNRPQAFMLLGQARLARFQPKAAMAAQERVMALRHAAGEPARKAREVILWAIAEEMLLDPQATSALAAAQAQGGAALVAAAAREIRSGSDQTGPALALFQGLRMDGRLDMRPEPGPGPIPQVIHQYWEGDMPVDLAAAMDRMQSCNPGWRHVLHDRDGALAYLARDGFPEGLRRAFQLARHAAERADIFRLGLLWREGGVYVDADDLARGPISAVLPRGAGFVCYQETYGTIGNNFLAVEAGNPALLTAMKSAIAETLSASAVSLWLRTGPGLVTRALAAEIARDPHGRLPEGWHVLRMSDLVPALSICVPLSYKMDARHWIRAA